MLYEYTSAAANNGSGFEGLGDNTPWWNISTGFVLLLGRYLPIIGPVAIAGILAHKKYIPESAGTLKTDTGTYGLMVFALLLDKTGTITIGNRKATHFYPAPGVDLAKMTTAAVLGSQADDTPEGKSIVELAQAGDLSGFKNLPSLTNGATFIKFTAETRSSGVDLPSGIRIRKGAYDAIKLQVEKAGNPFPNEVTEVVKKISGNGGTPLVVIENEQVMGTVELQDIIKPGISERFDRLRKMGVKTVMVTGDNPLTAKFIAEKAGVDDYIAEAKPEDKMNYIKAEQHSGKLVAMMGDGTNDAPALAQADVGVAMNSGTAAAKEAGNMVDLDNDPTKLIEVVEIGKQLLMTRGTLTTFSIANDVAKYFAIVPALFITSIPALNALTYHALAQPGERHFIGHYFQCHLSSRCSSRCSCRWL